MYINKFKMTTIIELLFTQECLNKLEELFYTTFYCNTYIGYENVLTELNRICDSRENPSSLFKDMLLKETIDTYLLFTQKNYTTDDNVMNEIIFHSVLKLFVDIIIIQLCLIFENKLKLLHTQFILPITGNINIKHFIQNNFQKIDHIYGEDIFEMYGQYGWNRYIDYIKEELITYFEFNSQGSILK